MVNKQIQGYAQKPCASCGALAERKASFTDCSAQAETSTQCFRVALAGRGEGHRASRRYSSESVP
jgi:hypothetical protein